MEPVLGTFGHDGWENDDGFDESKLPSSGYEYLRRVQLEAMQCPDVVVASFDTNSFQSKQTVHVNERSGWSPAPAGFAPSTDWQMEQAADFAEIRQKLVYHRSKLGKEDSTKLTLPKKSDSMGWCRFCLGEQTTMKIFGRKDNKKSVKDEDLLESSDSQGTNQDGTPPLLSVVLQINQLFCRCHAMLLLCDIQNNSWEENHTALRATLLQVLEFHVEWLEEIGFSHDQGKWFYALLVCLEKPLLPETTSLLRTLARLCATLRASLESPYHPLVTPLNLMITLVSRYFGQSDLADPG